MLRSIRFCCYVHTCLSELHYDPYGVLSLSKYLESDGNLGIKIRQEFMFYGGTTIFLREQEA